LNDKINERLTQALAETEQSEVELVETGQSDVEDVPEDLDESVIRVDKAKGIVTTADEIEGLFAVKSILRDTIDAKRVHMRDTKSYCGILLDDNNRKPICRLRFDGSQKYLGLIDDRKKEERVPIEDIDDIYNYADRIKATVQNYDRELGIPEIEVEQPDTGTLQNRNATYTGKKLLALHFQGQRYAVNSWKEGMMTLLELLRAGNPGKFEATAPTMAGRLRPYITTDSSKLRSAGKIPNTPYYVELNLSSQMIAKLCFDLAEKMRISETQIGFETD
jgi:negative regulator of replication initiation